MSEFVSKILSGQSFPCVLEEHYLMMLYLHINGALPNLDTFFKSVKKEIKKNPFFKVVASEEERITVERNFLYCRAQKPSFCECRA